jgi:hypothetical protein
MRVARGIPAGQAFIAVRCKPVQALFILLGGRRVLAASHQQMIAAQTQPGRLLNLACYRDVRDLKHLYSSHSPLQLNIRDSRHFTLPPLSRRNRIGIAAKTKVGTSRDLGEHEEPRISIPHMGSAVRCSDRRHILCPSIKPTSNA